MCGLLIKSTLTNQTLMNIIKIKDFTINLELNTVQTSPQGRPFRLSGTEIVLTEEPKWIDKVLTHKVIHTFKYLDAPNEFFRIKCDYFGKFECKLK